MCSGVRVWQASATFSSLKEASEAAAAALASAQERYLAVSSGLESGADAGSLQDHLMGISSFYQILSLQISKFKIS